MRSREGRADHGLGERVPRRLDRGCLQLLLRPEEGLDTAFAEPEVGGQAAEAQPVEPIQRGHVNGVPGDRPPGPRTAQQGRTPPYRLGRMNGRPGHARAAAQAHPSRTSCHNLPIDVALLAVPGSGTVPGYACRECGAVGVTRTGCACGRAVARRVPDLMEEMAVTAIRAGASVRTADDLPDGIAACLRFQQAAALQSEA